jgi:integration host factor subunit alpha
VRGVGGVSAGEAQRLVDEIIEHICRALETGEDVKLSSFATFKTRDKDARIGRNLKTGEEVQIAPRRVISFSAARSLKDKINARRREA